MKRLIRIMAVLFWAGVFMLIGCTQGILITKKDAQKEGQPAVEWQLGNAVEVADWVALKNSICEDLGYATATLPEQTRQDIYKYSCVKNDRHALGKTLDTLQPDQMQEIVKRLSEKGYNVNTDKILTQKGEIISAMLLLGISCFFLLSFSGG